MPSRHHDNAYSSSLSVLLLFLDDMRCCLGHSLTHTYPQKEKNKTKEFFFSGKAIFFRYFCIFSRTGFLLWYIFCFLFFCSRFFFRCALANDNNSVWLSKKDVNGLLKPKQKQKIAHAHRQSTVDTKLGRLFHSSPLRKHNKNQLSLFRKKKQK